MTEKSAEDSELIQAFINQFAQNLLTTKQEVARHEAERRYVLAVLALAEIRGDRFPHRSFSGHMNKTYNDGLCSAARTLGLRELPEPICLTDTEWRRFLRIIFAQKNVPKAAPNWLELLARLSTPPTAS